MSHIQAPQDPHRYTHLSWPFIFPLQFYTPTLSSMSSNTPTQLSPRMVSHTVHTRPFPGQPLLRTSPGREVQKLQVHRPVSIPSPPPTGIRKPGGTPLSRKGHITHPSRTHWLQKGPTPLILDSPPTPQGHLPPPSPPSPSHRRQSSQP